jgi:hypothetical protein
MMGAGRDGRGTQVVKINQKNQFLGYISGVFVTLDLSCPLQDFRAANPKGFVST